MQALRVLMVEDSAADAGLLALELRRAEFDSTYHRVMTRQAMAAALGEGPWDLIISDYHMPGFTGLEALEMMQQRGLDLPFIIVSGAIGEETAAEAMRAGAHDYILKDNLTRLGAAVRRELREATIRQERRAAIAALEKLARRSTLLAQASERLAASLNYNDTLEQAARVALPEIADWAVLTVADELQPEVRRVLAHVDPAKQQEGRDFLDRYTLAASNNPLGLEPLHSGQLEVHDGQDLPLLGGSEPERAALLERLGYRAAVSFPLVAMGRTAAALTLVWIEHRAETGDRELQQELAARAAMALENATLYRQAREAIRAREQFLSVASHELNTPLATLRLHLADFLDVTTASGDEPDAPPPSGLLVRRQLDRLSRLVSNLLDVSRIGARRLVLKRMEVDLGAITRDVVDQFAPELARVGSAISFVASRPVVGSWDPLQMAQIVTNLLSNACKYGEGKPIRVEVSATNGQAQLLVRDNGVGIPDEEMGGLFDGFDRPAAARAHGGLGLGLYLTRTFVREHGGNIRVESQVGSGTTFVVDLPQYPRSAEAASKAS